MLRKRKRKASTKLNQTAEGIGTAFGHVAARIEALKRERVEIAADIRKIVRSAQKLLVELEDTAVTRASAVRRIASAKGGRPKGYKMSEATKRKLRAAWKRRKDALKARVSG